MASEVEIEAGRDALDELTSEGPNTRRLMAQVVLVAAEAARAVSPPEEPAEPTTSAAEMRVIADRVEAGTLTATDLRAIFLRWHARICTCRESCCPKHRTHTDPHIGCVLR